MYSWRGGTADGSARRILGKSAATNPLEQAHWRGNRPTKQTQRSGPPGRADAADVLVRHAGTRAEGRGNTLFLRLLSRDAWSRHCPSPVSGSRVGGSRGQLPAPPSGHPPARNRPGWSPDRPTRAYSPGWVRRRGAARPPGRCSNHPGGSP